MVKTTRINAAALNVRGGLKTDKKHKLKLLSTFRRKHKLDILILSEHYLTDADSDRFDFINKYLGSTAHVHIPAPSPSKGGVSIFVFNPDIKINAFDTETLGIAACTVSWKSLDFDLAGVYLPSNGQQRIQSITDLSETLDNHFSTCLLMGDWNFVENFQLDKINSHSRAGLHGSVPFSNLLSSPLNLQDAWRSAHPLKQGATYTDRAQRGIRTRLDRAYSTPDLSQYISNPRHLPFGDSDHDAIFITLTDPNDAAPAPPRHIFDDTLLQNEDFVEEIEAIFDKHTPQSGPNLLHRFDKFLGRLERTSLKHSKLKKLSIDEKMLGYTRRIEAIDEVIASLPPGSVAQTDEITERALAHNEMENFERAAAASAIQQARTGHTLTGETPNRRTTKKLKGKHSRTTITSTMHNGREVFDIESILTSVHEYYTTLYDHKIDLTCPTVLNTRSDLYDSVTMKLTDSVRTKMETPLALSELETAVNQLGTSKVPGSDGLTVLFYRHFWPLLGPLLHSVWENSLSEGHLPESMSKALITLLHKKAERNLWKNYRPISLLQISYS